MAWGWVYWGVSLAPGCIKRVKEQILGEVFFFFRHILPAQFFKDGKFWKASWLSIAKSRKIFGQSEDEGWLFPRMTYTGPIPGSFQICKISAFWLICWVKGTDFTLLEDPGILPKWETKKMWSPANTIRSALNFVCSKEVLQFAPVYYEIHHDSSRETLELSGRCYHFFQEVGILKNLV